MVIFNVVKPEYICFLFCFIFILLSRESDGGTIFFDESILFMTGA